MSNSTHFKWIEPAPAANQRKSLTEERLDGVKNNSIVNCEGNDLKSSFMPLNFSAKSFQPSKASLSIGKHPSGSSDDSDASGDRFRSASLKSVSSPMQSRDANARAEIEFPIVIDEI